MHLRVTRPAPPFIFCFLFSLALLILWLLYHTPSFVAAESVTLPTVQFDATTNTVIIGHNSGETPATETIELPQLASALTAQGHGALLIALENQSWLLKANVMIERSARLNITASTTTWLKLDSPPATPVVVTVRRGGHLYLEGVKVTSWHSTTNTVDTTVADGRSYLLALEGGRLDVVASEIAYLGAESGEPSGLSWRRRLHDDDPTTGATGRVEESKIHDNYFGLYTYEAYGLQILHNEIFDNLYYGVDPHDDSRSFVVAYNRVYGNGTHGIIFSRGCIDNEIHDNTVFDNGQHGIMLDRGSNQNKVYANTVYNNEDGIAIFQSSGNLLYDNTLRANRRGFRINATFDAEDLYDGLATSNEIYDNLIEDSSEQGIYLYARADRNLLRNNQILRSGLNGIYIKSGGNRLEENTIVSGTVGITILGGDYRDDPPQALPALDPSGDNNLLLRNKVKQNSDVGIRVLGGSHNQIGPSVATAMTTIADDGNLIEANGKDGIAIGDALSGTASVDNLISHNTIRGNRRHGVLVTDQSSVRNRITLNSITGNGQLGIKIEKAAQTGIEPPTITTIAQEYIRGTTKAGAQVEVYSDPGDSGQRLLARVPAALHDESAPLNGQSAAGQRNRYLYAYSLTDFEGQSYLGTVTADATGIWSFPLPVGQNPDLVSVLAIDGEGNTSAFSGSLKGGTSASYEIGPDDNNQTTINVSGIGATITLSDIAANLGASDGALLQDLGNGLWLLNANLFLEIGVTLNLRAEDGIKELRLRSGAGSDAGSDANSDANSGALQAASNQVAAIDNSSFVYIRAYNGEINIDSIKIFSWDVQTNDYDRDPENGRAYFLAKYDAAMNIRNAEIGYLGSSDGESYGLTWRDVNDSSEPELLRTRVTGEVINSLIHHNYYGIYTFQASDMLFRNNKFYENVRYGFDPHDFSHDFLVEDNAAYNNGAHGFILSRGCNNFTLRNNQSYNNLDLSGSLAHGFMLDPGSPTSSDPQAPSYDNLLEKNEAYGNEGYGLRILGSDTNEVRDNDFHANEIGVSIEDRSAENLIVQNRLNGNSRYGIILQEKAEPNTVRANAVISNSDNGIYILNSANLVERNTVGQNGKAGIALLRKSGFPAPTANQLISNTVTGNLANGIDLRGAQQNEIIGNTVAENSGDGVYLKDGASQNSFINNCLCRNSGYGIEISGADSVQNLWSHNQIYGNGRGGIGVGGGALLLPPPILTGLTEKTVSGTSIAGATVEIYADSDAQGEFYLGRAIVDSDGTFHYTHSGDWPAANLTALVFDSSGSTSAFSEPLVVGQSATPTPTGTREPDVTPPTATPTPGHTIYLPLIES